MGDLLQGLAGGASHVFALAPLLAILAGVACGIVVGAMPGLSPSMGVALLVPFTYALPPNVAIILLVSVYLAANYGGSITAIMLNTPGTPASVVTAFDGYPLTRQGKPGQALGTALVASTVGGVLGTLILIFFSAPLAKVALGFHPAEYFALAVFGMTTVASLAGRNWLKALAMALLGLALQTIGLDPISGVSRFTFGSMHLYDGFALVPALIGLFAVSEILLQAASRGGKGAQATERSAAPGDESAEGATAASATAASTTAASATAASATAASAPAASGVGGAEGGRQWPSPLDYWRLKFNIARSALVGAVIGIFPGAGATIASFVSYDVARRVSRAPERFGHGSVEGVAASQAANSASVGGALVPLLTLGIPGSATTAVLIGALMIHDLVPGPRLFAERPDLVYGLFVALLLANATLLVLGMAGSQLWVRVARVPRRILLPLVGAFAVVGSFAVRFSLFDVGCCVAFGGLGWLLRRHDYPVAPIVLGLVLGGILETNFRRAVMMGGYGIFFTRPVSAVLLGVALLSFAVPIWRGWREKSRRTG